MARVLVPLFAAHGLHSGIKWPNDFFVITPNGRHKIAGVLIEQSDGVAVVGIGVNVLRRQWSGQLASIASSLATADTKFVPLSNLWISAPTS